jgi:hypothetical protein
MRKLAWAVLVVAVSVSLLTSCGGGTTPATPTPTPEPTPTPAPTPTPLPLSVIPPCPVPASNPGSSAVCLDPLSQLETPVRAAIDRTMKLRPELFDFKNVNGGPEVLDIPAYQTAVVAALGEAGYCGRVDPEGEIGVKKTNAFSEQWIIVSHAGWGVPTDKFVEHKYRGACAPSTF